MPLCITNNSTSASVYRLSPMPSRRRTVTSGGAESGTEAAPEKSEKATGVAKPQHPTAKLVYQHTSSPFLGFFSIISVLQQN